MRSALMRCDSSLAEAEEGDRTGRNSSCIQQVGRTSRCSGILASIVQCGAHDLDVAALEVISRFIALATFFWTGIAFAAVPEASVVKVRAVAADGEIKWGSAVVIAPERLATTCHVTRRAATIEILHGDDRWIVRKQEGSAVHDLCVLTVEGLRLPAVHMRAAYEVAVGERVTAAGYEHGGSLVVHWGTVKKHYAYDDGMVIRTAAAFDFGSSGGGLFDEAGNLVALLSFRARNGGDLRFALPSEWLDPLSVVATKFGPIDPSSPRPAFWERTAPERPDFLGAALREGRESP
jgi:S1-C subfamily serine protease